MGGADGPCVGTAYELSKQPGCVPCGWSGAAPSQRASQAVTLRMSWNLRARSRSGAALNTTGGPTQAHGVTPPKA